MSIDNITGKILSEAEEQGNRILESAYSESQRIIDEAKRKAEEIQEKAKEKIDEDQKLLKSRRVSVAELEVRKIRLGAKQAQISLCFEKALDRLSQMDEQAYLELLATFIIKIGGDGGELILNKNDREKIGKKLINKINNMEKVGKLSLAEDTIDAKGGFVLRRGSVEINSTLETIVNGIRESATPEVVKALYGK